jgi:hypothetical protein
MKAQKGSRKLNSFFNLGTRWWVVIAHPRSLYRLEWSIGYPLYRGLDNSSDLVCTGAENLGPTETRSPGRPARSESLYRLSYPSPLSSDKALLYTYRCSVHSGRKEAISKKGTENIQTFKLLFNSVFHPLYC